MKKITKLVMVSLAVVMMVFGCTLGNDFVENTEIADKGSVSFDMDLSTLAAQTKSVGSKGTTATITKVDVILSRLNYTNITKALTIVSNKASGTIANLEAGYWNVVANVYENATLIYTGTVDVNVVAGASVPCNILFDPIPPTTGSIDFTVGINPLPGYKALGITATSVIANNTAVYVFDSSSSTIVQYSIEMVRQKDIAVPLTPVAIAFNYAKDRIYVAYPSGAIHSLDPATGALTLVADCLMSAKQMVALNATFLFVYGSGSEPFKTINVTNGQIADKMQSSYTMANLEFNATTSTIYTHSVGVSPSDIHRIRLNLTTGDIVSTTDSSYHGDYTNGTPVRVIKNGSKVLTSSGDTFACSTVDTNDMIYSGSLGFSYIDLASDDNASRLYILGSATPYKLISMNTSNDFQLKAIDVLGSPVSIFKTATTLVVLVKDSGKTYTKTFLKSDLL